MDMEIFSPKNPEHHYLPHLTLSISYVTFHRDELSGDNINKIFHFNWVFVLRFMAQTTTIYCCNMK